jgi:hypothetical protein
MAGLKYSKYVAVINKNTGCVFD